MLKTPTPPATTRETDADRLASRRHVLHFGAPRTSGSAEVVLPDSTEP